MKRTPTSLIALGLVAAMTLACAEPAEESVLTAAGGGASAPVSGDPAAIADQAVEDVSTYWSETYPEIYGGDFEPLAGFYPYGPDTAPPPCGSPPPAYDMIADNAFYCPGDDIIAWDEYSLMPKLNQEFGAFTVAIVIAHEFGHAVQDRFVTYDRTVDLELQADCFAGAWTGRVAAGEADGFDPEDIDLDKTVAGMIAIRDVPGTPPDDPYAHGSGFDRVAAFQDGYENGASTCEPYADENSDRFTSEIEWDYEAGEDLTGGNLPLEGEDNIYDLVHTDLNDFYSWLFEEVGAPEWTPIDDLVVVDPSSDAVTCGGDTLEGDELSYAAVYCEDENIAVIDGTDLAEDLYEYGDFAVASELAQIWAVAAQAQLGTDSGDADLQADCLTGLWAASTFPGVEDVTPDSNLVISAGDLDEGIQGFLAYGTMDQDRTVFERTTALRTGVFEAIAGCEQYGSLG